MKTLLLLFNAPLQAWGGPTKFDYRETEREVTKSGMVGVLAAALGRRRSEPITDLAKLKFGVRVLREGHVFYDFQMVTNPDRAADNTLKYSYYLADAVFLTAINGEDNFIFKLAEAVRKPYFPIYCGRRSCPVTPELYVGISELSVEKALKSYQPVMHNDAIQRYIVDAGVDDKNAVLSRDLPVTFDRTYRQYQYRNKKEYMDKTTHPEEHDAFERG
ncbi:type I-E CRISPR-associated protein Cas5/CasD [Megasphaera sueciensis]|uniref:type I-E CRISPR-associated protein Cas5/CasD n=1 Tax=Megasphaera sueciensis TaxID=349094 RepID=UPI003CFD0107